jgi:hypothetical protein
VSAFSPTSVLGTSLMVDYSIQTRVRYTRVCAYDPSRIHSAWLAVVRWLIDPEDGTWAYFLFPRFPESEVLLWGCVGSMYFGCVLQIQAQNVCGMDHIG